MNKENIIILIDEPLNIDRRVQNIIKKYKNPIIEECSDLLPFSYYMYFLHSRILLKTTILIPFYWFKLFKKYKLRPKSILAGIKHSLRVSTTAINKSNLLKYKFKDQNISTIYANDLRCGLIGMYLAEYFNAELIYDSHEIGFHRNRKNSLLRVIFEILLEKNVVNKASKIIVVNKPIANVYRYIYQISRNKISIINNMFFQGYYGYALNNFNNNNNIDTSITYVGSAIDGRKLEKLTKEAFRIDINLYGFFLLKAPKIASRHPWRLGSKDYLPELLQLVKTNRLAMWACTETSCLSYRLSLGNKFFQAMSLGIPVIASKNTYLAELITLYDLGYVYDDSNLKEIIFEMQNNKKYSQILQSIKIFQQKLFSREINL